MSESVNVTYVGAEGEPDTNVWKGYSFRKGEPVAVTDPHIIAKAKGNRFFEVEGHVKRPQEADGHDGGDIGDLEKMGIRKLREIAAAAAAAQSAAARAASASVASAQSAQARINQLRAGAII